MKLNEFDKQKTEKLKGNLKAVVFDMDGLMFNTEWLIKYCWDVTGKEMGYDNFGDNIYNTLGMNYNRRREYFLDKYGEDFDFEGFTDRYREVSADYLAKNGTPVKKGLINILEFLKENKIKMAVATSSSRKYAMSKICDVGIEGYFDTIICGDMVTKSKPDPQIYKMACDGLGVDYTSCIAFEDSPNGIRSAYAAGMNPIMIPDLLADAPEEVEEMIVAKLEDLDEAIKFLKNILEK